MRYRKIELKYELWVPGLVENELHMSRENLNLEPCRPRRFLELEANGINAATKF